MKRTYALLGPILAALVTSCSLVTIGDASQNVNYYNAADIPLLVFETRDQPLARLSPGESKRGSWLISGPPDKPRFRYGRVEARDDEGKLEFCKVFTYEELAGTNWRIELKQGEFECT